MFFCFLRGCKVTRSPLDTVSYTRQSVSEGVICIDWRKIQTEYITDETASYRKLAKKYGVGLTALTARAKREDWTGKRKQLKDETDAKTLHKIAEGESDKVARFFALTDALYEKLVAALTVVEATDTQGIRQLTASVKDWKEMHGIKSEADMREQEARIAKLQRDTQAEDSGPAEIKVIFGTDNGEDTSEWAE